VTGESEIMQPTLSLSTVKAIEAGRANGRIILAGHGLEQVPAQVILSLPAHCIVCTQHDVPAFSAFLTKHVQGEGSPGVFEVYQTTAFKNEIHFEMDNLSDTNWLGLTVSISSTRHEQLLEATFFDVGV